MYIISIKTILLSSVIVVGALVLNVTTAESKSRKTMTNLTKLQGTWIGYGRFKNQKSRCDVTIKNRNITALCGNASGAIRSFGRVRGSRKMWAKWESEDGLYTGISKFGSIRRKSHTMRIYVDGYGSGKLDMRK